MNYRDPANMAEIELDERNYNPNGSYYQQQQYQESRMDAASYQGSQQPQYPSRGASYSSQQQPQLQPMPRVAPRSGSRDGSYQGSQQQLQYQPRNAAASSYSRDFDYIEGQASPQPQRQQYQEQRSNASLNKQSVVMEQEVSRAYSQDMVSTSQMVEGPPPDHMSRSTASLFICFLWGIFAWHASNKVRKLNRMKAYDEALYYSTMARQHNDSALACFVICMFIFGVPAIVSLATQGSISKYPSAREFFG